MSEAADGRREIPSAFRDGRRRRRLTEDEAASAFDAIMEGGVPEMLLAGFLVALRRAARRSTRSPARCAPCAAGCARSRRPPARSTSSARAATPRAPTTSPRRRPSCWRARACRWPSMAIAPCRPNPARADVLEGLGVNLAMTPDQAEICLAEAGIAFLFAPTYHPAMRHAAPVRQGLKLRTIFNLLGPLSNPAGVKRQMIGVFSPHLARADRGGDAPAGRRACLGGAWP